MLGLEQTIVAINIWFAGNKFLQCLFSLPSSTIVLQLLISRKSQEKLERQILCHILWCPLSPPFWLLSTNLKNAFKVTNYIQRRFATFHHQLWNKKSGKLDQQIYIFGKGKLILLDIDHKKVKLMFAIKYLLWEGWILCKLYFTPQQTMGPGNQLILAITN